MKLKLGPRSWRALYALSGKFSDLVWKIESETYTPVVEAAKRLGVRRAPGCGDWFTPYSPRNSNLYGEGYWDHWVDLAILILQHDLTAIVRPDAHEVVSQLHALNLYSQVNRKLSEDEIRAAMGELK